MSGFWVARGDKSMMYPGYVYFYRIRPQLLIPRQTWKAFAALEPNEAKKIIGISLKPGEGPVFINTWKDLTPEEIRREEEAGDAIGIPTAIESIKFRMEQGGLTRNDLVGCLGSRSRVSEILSGKRKLTLPMIRRLYAIGIPLTPLCGVTVKMRKAARRAGK